MEKRWILTTDNETENNSISWNEICDLPCIIRLLARKGFLTADEVQSFLDPRLKSLGDPFLLPNMNKAVERILRAIDARERIVLFGDYDVDGVTSLALLAEMLRAYGTAPELFLPLRIEEGYGLSQESLERCRDLHRPQLLIAIDCGTSSVKEIAALGKSGVDVIVLDHHEPKKELPDCVALVNPKTAAAPSDDYLCSAGVVFKLCHALLKTRPVPEFDLKSRLDLVALGTVADIVPLRFENRILVRAGARQIASSRRPGLRKLMEIAAVRPPIATEDIGFRLGPRLNAAGRLHTAEKALRLLLTENENEATELAQLLDTQNRERQSVEKELLTAVEKQIEEQCNPAADAAIVVGARDWHPGVLGIVASRIARKYHRPTIIIGFDAEGIGKGSGRSIEAFSLVGALERCSNLLEKFGGHEMAAGLTIREKNLPSFAEAFRQVAREILSEEDLQPRLQIDHELKFSELNLNLLRWHEMLQPFGSGNPQPLFVSREVEPTVEPKVLHDRHLVLRLRQRNHFQRAIFFDGATGSLPPSPWDIAFQIKRDEYEGVMRLQLHVQALRKASSFE